MAIQSNKPIIFAVHHDTAPVAKVFKSFAETIKGKKFLYIELSAEALNDTGTLRKLNPGAAAYKRLALEARRQGLEVIPLDKIGWAYSEQKVNPNPTLERILYQKFTKREKRWEPLLAKTSSGTVVVMNVPHALKVVELLKIPESNIAYMEPLPKYTALGLPEHRRLMEEEAKFIETQRLARRLRNAQQRAKNPKRKMKLKY